MQRLLINTMIDFLLYERGESFTLNGTRQRALFNEAENKIDYFDDKIMITKFLVPTGSLIQYQGYNWFVISQVDNNNAEDNRIFKCRVREVEQSIKVSINNKVYVFPVIFTSPTQSVANDKYLMLATGKILATVQDDSDASNLALNLRFIKMGSAWKITGTDKSKLGLIVLTCDVDLFQTNDDKVNEIAYNASQDNTPPSNLAISGATSIYVGAQQTYTIANNTNNNTFNWSLIDAISGSPTTYASIKSSTTTTCTVLAGAIGGKSVKLQASCIENPSTILYLIFTTSSGF